MGNITTSSFNELTIEEKDIITEVLFEGLSDPRVATTLLDGQYHDTTLFQEPLEEKGGVAGLRRKIDLRVAPPHDTEGAQFPVNLLGFCVANITVMQVTTYDSIEDFADAHAQYILKGDFDHEIDPIDYLNGLIPPQHE